MKVRLADIIKPAKNVRNRTAAFRRISQKHIDFVIVSTPEFEIVCCIELNDRSHNSKDRAQRDKFVRHALSTANIPFVEIKAQRAYKIKDIAKMIEEAIV